MLVVYSLDTVSSWHKFTNRLSNLSAILAILLHNITWYRSNTAIQLNSMLHTNQGLTFGGRIEIGKELTDMNYHINDLQQVVQKCN